MPRLRMSTAIPLPPVYELEAGWAPGLVWTFEGSTDDKSVQGSVSKTAGCPLYGFLL
jgi:hypothetical protein